MTDVSVRDLASGTLRAAVSGGIARRLMPLRRAAASDQVDVALSKSPRLAPPPATPDAVLEWLRRMPGHWRGRALARRELAASSTNDAEVREHLAMADLYDRLALAREGEMLANLPRTEFDRWGWRAFAAPSIPADAEAGRRRKAPRAPEHAEGTRRVTPRIVASSGERS
jgi:hypothetical protein